MTAEMTVNMQLSAGFSVDLFDSWIQFLDASPKTIEVYTRSIRQFGRYLQENGIRQPTRETIVSYRNHLLETGHAAGTVQSYLVSVRAFFAWTEAENLYPNIAVRVKSPKTDKEHKRDPLTSGQVNDTLTAIDLTTPAGMRDYSMIALMVCTGLRTISVARANVEDLRTRGNGTVLYYQGKGHTEKAVFVKVPPQVEKPLRSYIKSRGKLTGSEPLFGSLDHKNPGGRLTTRSISRIVKNRLGDVDIESDRLTAHSLRHTAATLDLLTGGTTEDARRLLDHSSVATTQIYVHEMERDASTSENRIAAAIFG